MKAITMQTEDLVRVLRMHPDFVNIMKTMVPDIVIVDSDEMVEKVLEDWPEHIFVHPDYMANMLVKLTAESTWHTAECERLRKVIEEHKNKSIRNKFHKFIKNIWARNSIK